jgi:guanylate kinase
VSRRVNGRGEAKTPGTAAQAARREPLPREPFPLILCAPTGTGKTTLARELLRRRADVAFSVSVTTRPRRPGERDGVDYHFVSEDGFDRMRRAGELLEWARVHRWHYGTPARNLREAAAAGKHLVLDIDVQGARQVKRAVPSAVSVFLLPPSFAAWLARLEARASEDEAERRRRLRTGLSELEAVPEFDFVVVNDRLDDTVAALGAILDAESRRVRRRRREVVRLRDELLEALRAYLAEGESGG